VTSNAFLRHLPGILLAALLAAGPACAAPKPAALERIEAALWDDPRSVLRDAESALRQVSPTADDATVLDAALRLALAGEALEQSDVARRGLERAMPLARKLHDDGALCALYGSEAFVAQTPGPAEVAIQRYAEAIAFARRAGMDWCEARQQLGQGQVYSAIHRGAEALAAMVQAHRMLERLNDRPGMASVLSDLSWIYHREHDNPQSLQRAIDTGEAALALLDPPKQRHLAGVVHHNLAGAYFVSDKLAQAREHIGRATTFSIAIGDAVGLGFVANLHGDIEMKAGRPARALPLFEQAQSVFQRYDIPDMVVKARVGRVDALTALHRRAEAQHELDAAEPVRRQVDTAATDVVYHRAALNLFETFGDFEHALRASKALGAAQQRQVADDNRKAANELQERFEAQRRDAENKALREQQRAAESQQWLLLATLLLSAALMAVMGAYLLLQRRLRQRLAQLAACDELTGMPNRRSILETARQVNADRRRSQESACVAMLDIDHFKAINDRYGHEVGDAALVTFARVCGENLRAQDRLGRFGGEEFLLVLPGARVSDLPMVFERLQAGLRCAPVPGMPAEARLAFSMGGSLFRGDDEVEQAIHRADAALYRAKAAGRDRLAVAASA